MTNNENATNSLYAFKFRNEELSEIITYNNNVTKAILEHAQKNGCLTEEMKIFPTDKVSGIELERFARLVEQKGYQIFRIFKI